MEAWRATACWALLPLLASVGCRSNLGAAYGVAAGTTVAADALPERRPAVGPVARASFAPQADGGPPPAEVRPIAPGEDPLPEPTREEAFAAVLGDLQAIGASNPAAQQELLRRLQSAPPGEWELMARRFRSELSYHRQLTTGEPPPPAGGGAVPASHDSPELLPAETEQTPPVRAQPEQASLRAASGRSAVRLASVEVPTTNASAPPPGSPSQPLLVSNPYQQERRDFADTGPADPGAGAAVCQACRPAGAEPPAAASKVAAPTADEAVAEAIARMVAEAADEPLTSAEAYTHARVRLLRVAAGDLDGAVAPIPGLQPTEQGYWSKQLFAISTMLDHEAQPESGRRAAAAGLHLLSAQQQLSQMAALAVRNLTFCTAVEAYGAYRQRPSRTFRPGEDLNLYVEVANFRTRRSGDGFESLIGGSYRVVNSEGDRVDGREFPPVDDFCLSRRRDFHIHYGIALPEQIPPGEYQLELTLHDQLAGKMGHASIDFEIAGVGPARGRRVSR